MNPLLGIAAAVAAVIGLCLLWWRRSVTREVDTMASTMTSRAGDVAKLPPGMLVEVKGTLRVREPLTAEFSRKPAAYYKSEIYRVETYWENDAQGRPQQRTRTTIVYADTKYGSCLVEDGSGRVGIDYDGAEVEAVPVISNEATAAPPDTTAGAASMLLTALSNATGVYTRSESILAPDIPIYVIGEVHPGGLIGKPAEGSKNKLFVISSRSEEERSKSLLSTGHWIVGFAIALFAIAVALLVWAIKEGP